MRKKYEFVENGTVKDLPVPCCSFKTFSHVQHCDLHVFSCIQHEVSFLAIFIEEYCYI